MAHVYNGIFLSHKRNDTELFVARWMDSETVIQSEVCQKMKNKYCMLTRIYVVNKTKQTNKQKTMVLKIGRASCRERV